MEVEYIVDYVDLKTFEKAFNIYIILQIVIVQHLEIGLLRKNV